MNKTKAVIATPHKIEFIDIYEAQIVMEGTYALGTGIDGYPKWILVRTYLTPTGLMDNHIFVYFGPEESFFHMPTNDMLRAIDLYNKH